MPNLAVTRRGWQNEHLAAFLLSKVAFIAQPSKIGDDLGTDFFCTSFEIFTQNRIDFLILKSSFAIQIKSGGRTVNVTKQIEYLERLELPFFVGIVNQESSVLEMYSGENLPILFSHKGIPKSLVLKLEAAGDLDMESYLVEKGDNSFILRCPLVARLAMTMTSEAVVESSRQLRKVVSKTQMNIAARTTKECVFGIGEDGQTTVIMMGPGSAEVFRENFRKRLAEACWNLVWIVDNPNYGFDVGEGRFYVKICDDMLDLEGELPQYLSEAAKELKKRLSA